MKNFNLNSNIIVGRNPVKEAIKSNQEIEFILISKGEKSGSILKIIKAAKDKKIIIKEVDNKKLDSLSNGISHQGIIAISAVYKYADVNDIMQKAKNKGEPVFIIIADEIEDPYNLGAIIRTAECVGAHGVIIPKRRACPVTEAVHKCSAGATQHMLIAKVTNLSATIDKLKESGIWCYCADMNGENCFEADLLGPIALVVGSEGHGVGKLIKSKCDGVLSLPIKGKVNSLNASVAAGTLMYEVLRQRNKNLL